jgi:hypothetical protein
MVENNTDFTTASKPNFPDRLRRASFVIAAFIGASVVITGCSSGTTSSTGSSSKPAANNSSAYESELAYASCMRSNGEPNFPDPKPGGGFNVNSNPNAPQLRAAQRACQSLLPGGSQQETTGGNFTTQQVAQLLKYAQCMRAHKVLNFPDPTSKGLGSLQGVDMNSPQFQAASEACQPLLPNQGGSGPVTRPGGTP